MFISTTTTISWDGFLNTFDNVATGFKIVGRDRRDDCFPTKILAINTNTNNTSWVKITANGIDLICQPTTLVYTTLGPIAASAITTSHFIQGFTGTTVYSFTAGGPSSHSTIRTNYNALFSSFAVTANVSYVLTATAYGLRTSVGRYFANRFLVHDS